jgi:hypothetical protein
MLHVLSQDSLEIPAADVHRRDRLGGILQEYEYAA